MHNVDFAHNVDASYHITNDQAEKISEHPLPFSDAFELGSCDKEHARLRSQRSDSQQQEKDPHCRLPS